ncbi:hypothetical protein [Endozoicomonas sp. ALD040]|uniref:hypothetical protein n=1 Tax=Endozoicomonas sp. ALD040 TaxID=3403079 RepID=UPI003BAEFE7C
MLLLLTVACRAETLTGRYIVELQQDAAFSNQSFSLKQDQRALSDNPSDITEKNGFKRPDLPSDDKRQRFFSYEVKTTFIESISWQLLYATNLLVTFELIMTSKTHPPGSTSYSCSPVEGIVTVGWLLKNYWNPDSSFFKPIKQSGVRLARGNEPIAITTMMHGSGYNQQQPQQQSQLSESSGQQAPQAISQQTGSFTSPLYSGFGDGFGDPQQQAHTLGLDCFVHPCYGICIFRSSFENMGPDERSLNSEESLARLTEAKPGQNSCPHNCLCYGCIWNFDPANETSSDPSIIELQWASGDQFQVHGIDDKPVNTTAALEQVSCHLTMVDEDGELRNCEKVYKSVASLLNHQRKIHTGKKTCLATVVEKDGRQRPCGEVCKNASNLSNHRRRVHSGQQTCNFTVVEEDGQQRPCGTVWKNAGALSNHKIRTHTGQQTCDVTVVEKDGQQRPCGTVCKSTRALSFHKRGYHSGQKTCEVIVVGKDDKPQPCGRVCKNSITLSHHKRNAHTAQRTCDLIVVGKDGQPRPCGKLCKSAQSFSCHKFNQHTGKKTCNLTVVEENDQQRPCGTVCKNAKALWIHKLGYHSEQKTCDVIVVDEYGLQRPCGKVYKNVSALCDHKRRPHTGLQACDVMTVGEDGKQWPCGRVYKNAKALSVHKRIHRKRKPVAANQKDAVSPP